MGVLQTELKGFGAEHLVRADLLFNGIATHSPDLPGTPYDIVALINGNFRKIQVKCRTKDSKNRVKVDIRKSNGVRIYTEVDCDIMAIVEPELRLIAYLPYEVWFGKTQVTLYTQFMPVLNGTKTQDERLYFADYSRIA